MRLHNTSKSTKGFTLIEVLVVLSMLAIVAALAVFVSMDTYRGSSFRADRDLLVALLQHARAEAIHNICAGTSCTNTSPAADTTHGLYVGATTYTLFQGSSYALRTTAEDQNYSEDALVSRTGATEVVFQPLTGTVAAQATITLTGSGKTSVITIEPSGRIWWTN
jgi:type IV fimbrial biogenesis protein FimT